MSTLADRIARFALGLRWADLPEDVCSTARVAVADALACAIAGTGEPAGRSLRDYATAVGSSPAATLLGTGERVDVPLAALVNSTLVRDLDANDLYAGPPARDTGHFSDAIPALLSSAEAAGSSGEELLAAVVVAYEVQASLAEAYLWMQRGLHSVSQVAWALPAALGRLRGLTHDEIVHAIGVSGTTSGLVLQSWLRQDSSMSDIKAVSTGLVAMGAVRSTELAALGLTAPRDALETLFDRLPSKAQPEAIWRLEANGPFRTAQTMIKRYPAQIFLQAGVQAALEARRQLGGWRAIDAVVVESHEKLAGGVQGSASAYRPATRASADHSAPFVIAMALRDGDLTPASYAGEPWADPEVIELMDKIELVVDHECDCALRERGLLGCHMTVTTSDGGSASVSVRQQKGHPDNPLDEAELLSKLRMLVEPRLGEGAGDALWDAVSRLAQAPTVAQLVAACVAA